MPRRMKVDMNVLDAFLEPASRADAADGGGEDDRSICNVPTMLRL